MPVDLIAKKETKLCYHYGENILWYGYLIQLKLKKLNVSFIWKKKKITVRLRSSMKPREVVTASQNRKTILWSAIFGQLQFLIFKNIDRASVSGQIGIFPLAKYFRQFRKLKASLCN
jgi:hypothetical protein